MITLIENPMQQEEKTNLINNIRTLVDSISKIIQPIPKLKNFINRNPLGGLDDLEFSQALKEGYHLFQQKKLPLKLHDVNRETLKACKIFFENQTINTDDNKKLSFYKSWQKLAINDEILQRHHSFPILFLNSLPNEPELAIYNTLLELQIPKNQFADFLIIITTTQPGWAGFAKHYSYFLEYLAIRLIITHLLYPQASELLTIKKEDYPNFDAIIAKINNNETTYKNHLKHLFKSTLNSSSPLSVSKPDIQLIFCVDTRSEILRKYIESHDNYETFGYVGSFGLPISVKDQNSGEITKSCPSVIQPKYIIPLTKNNHQAPSIENIPFQDQCFYAKNLLKTIGLTKNFAPLIIFCGHGAYIHHYPLLSALNCGACSGRHGQENAQIMATILNNKDVRNQLKKENIDIPENTLFLAANHNTTTNSLEILDNDTLEPSQNTLLTQFKKILPNPINKKQKCEWGLSKNASMIIAPRAISKNLDLQGRSFLHSYSWENDPTGEILQNILNGPLFVAHSINMQYFFSTLDNNAYGAGNDTTQNFIEKLDIIQSNDNDLKYGLPLEIVNNDVQETYHELIRLTVIVHALPENIDKAIHNNKTLAKLIRNHWIILIAINPLNNEIKEIEI